MARPTGRGARLATVAAVAALCACGMTSSTEVGVRTNLVRVLEKRGDQQIYEPGGVYFILPVVNAWAGASARMTSVVTNTNPCQAVSGGEQGPLETLRLPPPLKLTLLTVRPSAVVGIAIQPGRTVSKSIVVRDDVSASKAVRSS